MNLIHLSTRRPVAISMVALAILLFGMVSLGRLPVTLLPELNYPTLTVRTELPGAAPTEVETLISKPMEEALGVVRGIREVRSVSQAGQSDVTLEFDWGTQMDYAVLDVREKLDTLDLPDEAERPVVLRFDPSEDPIVRLGLAFKPEPGKVRQVSEADLKRLRRVAEDMVQRPLQASPGVAAVKISGGLEDEVQVRVDLHKMASLGITLKDISDRLAAENANISGGRVDEGTASYLVRTLNQFQSLDEIRDTILVARGDRPIYVKDVAEISSGFKEREAIIRLDGEEAVEISLYKEGDGNTVKIARSALQRVEALRKALPPDMELKLLYDQSVFIQQAIDSVSQSALIGGLLAVFVLYLFLRDAWTTAVVSVAIPASVIATFNVMYGAGLTLNIMSLGGIALAIGMLVDNAIVVLENIARKREHGLPPLMAAEVGTREMAGAVVASTLTTVAVFFPMVFVEGIAGQLFSDQALVVSASLVVSLLVAMTLIPMLASREARPGQIHPADPLVGEGRARRGLSRTRWFVLETLPSALLRPLVWLWRALVWLLTHLLRPLATVWGRGFERLSQVYARALDRTLQQRGLVIAMAVLLFAGSLGLAKTLGVELIPPFNQGEFMAELKLAPGTPLESTDALVRRLSAKFIGDPRLAANYSVAGTGNRLDANAESGGRNTGTLNFVMARNAFSAEDALQDELRPLLDALPGVSYQFTRPALFTLSTPLEIEVAGYNLDELRRVSEALRSRMLASDRFTEVETTQAPGQPEIQIEFDQERAAALGLDTSELAERVVGAVQGDVATRYRLADREIDVLVRGQAADRTSLQAVRDLVINPESPRPVTLSSVADVQLHSGPSEIRRQDQQRVVLLSANITHGDLGQAVSELQGMIGSIAMPNGVSTTVSGQSEEMEVSFRSLQLALGLAVFLVYIVMASQFESLKQPFVILFTIPLAAIGAVLSLWITGMVVNVIALIGLIVLAGIVVNNGIVLITTINSLRLQGLPRHQAIIAAGQSRLRPIMMTTLTTVLGLLPVALAGGEGSEVSRPMAIVVVGGLSAATLLTLFVIPVVYTLIDGRERPLRVPEERDDHHGEQAGVLS